MTVEELIQTLSKLPPGSYVGLEVGGYGAVHTSLIVRSVRVDPDDSFVIVSSER